MQVLQLLEALLPCMPRPVDIVPEASLDVLDAHALDNSVAERLAHLSADAALREHLAANFLPLVHKLCTVHSLASIRSVVCSPCWHTILDAVLLLVFYSVLPFATQNGKLEQQPLKMINAGNLLESTFSQRPLLSLSLHSASELFPCDHTVFVLLFHRHEWISLAMCVIQFPLHHAHCFRYCKVSHRTMQSISVLVAILYAATPDDLQSSLRHVPFSSFVKSLLCGEDAEDVAAGCVLSQLLLTKLPAIFVPAFAKEGTYISLKHLAAKAPAPPKPKLQVRRFLFGVSFSSVVAFECFLW